MLDSLVPLLISVSRRCPAGVQAKAAIRKQLVHRRYRTNRPSSLTKRVRASSGEPRCIFLPESVVFGVKET